MNRAFRARFIYIACMPPRLRPTRLEYVVDGYRLRAQLTAAALSGIGTRPNRGGGDRGPEGRLFRGRMIAKERLENGAGGVETARLICGSPTR